jgi:hypothetical protein
VSFSAFDATLVCEPRTSRRLRALSAAVWLVAGGGALVALGPVPGAVIAAAALGGAFTEDRRLVRPSAPLFFTREGDCRVGDPDGPVHHVDGATWTTPWLILLVLRGPAGPVRYALARDALDGPTWRRLRARLRIEGPAAAGTGAAS